MNVNDELQRMWKEESTSYFKVFFQDFHEGAVDTGLIAVWIVET